MLMRPGGFAPEEKHGVEALEPEPRGERTHAVPRERRSDVAIALAVGGWEAEHG